jgi:hypothetical protein
MSGWQSQQPMLSRTKGAATCPLHWWFVFFLRLCEVRQEVTNQTWLEFVKTQRWWFIEHYSFRTTNWVRSESAVESMNEALETAIEKNGDPLPAGTAEVCTRYVVINSHWCWCHLYIYMR